MAITKVQVTPKNSLASGTSNAVTFASPPTVGNSIIVVSICGVGTSSTCTDNRGNTYTLVKSRTEPAIPVIVDMFLAPVTTTGSPFTVTCTGANSSRILVAYEIGGTLAVDQSAASNTSGTTAVSGTTPAIVASDVFQVAVLGTNSSINTVAVASPVWTEDAEEVSVTFAKGESDSRIVTSATGTTPSASWSLNGASFYAAIIVAFSSSGGGGGGGARNSLFIWS